MCEKSIKKFLGHPWDARKPPEYRGFCSFLGRCQACSSDLYFRIAWKSMKQPCFLQNRSLSFLQGLRSLKNWLLQKLNMKSLDQNVSFLVENGYFVALIFQAIEFLNTYNTILKLHNPQKFNFQNFIYCKNYSYFND